MMRIKSLLALLLVIVAVPTMAQNHKRGGVDMVYGVAGGVTFPVLDISGADVELSSKLGYKLGIQWGVDFGVVDIVPELWYSSFKMGFDTNGTSGVKLKNSSLDMPILVGIRVANPVKLHLGPAFSLMCNNEIAFDDGKVLEYGRIKSNVGYVVGVSYQVFRSLFLDFRYTGRFTAAHNEWEDGSSHDIMMYTLDLTAGFKF